ncbi:DNA cytosine methyltransferase [Bacillus wiedmannii]|uniref:DNA cytosine methyltransferase n=1 Tax=Bacillus wiedmannii TaxID=1890302 RepID=UPI0007DAEE4A|nr:DNA cytosine methyltransferase [Bacillus wiedmannii]OAK13801.1 DNA cytosine methyltransferase [Bacillus wiedmannii]OAK22311.1 DNA cytosine methyltransferase [Bacillus wiedmannii]
MAKQITGLSIFSGAGGMDVGFKNAGVNIVWSNEMDKNACNTYEANHPETLLRRGDIQENLQELYDYQGKIDVVFGGPPCQGFSVAGKMDPNDERSKLIWTYLEVIEIVQPKAFVLENVSALAKLEKWKDVRENFINKANELGYQCHPFVLNSADFGISQKRERVFFVGIRNDDFNPERFILSLESKKCKPKTIREIISHLGPAGSPNNPMTCTAKVTLALNPIMRKSPYAGMIFNGMGRPLNLEDISNTLPASMGGNKTPIVDEALLHQNAEDSWVENYHKALLEKTITSEYKEAPSRLRRLTIKEAALIQTFPEDYLFCGSKTAIYKQIGNAVPCKLSEVVASTLIEELRNITIPVHEQHQLSLLAM